MCCNSPLRDKTIQNFSCNLNQHSIICVDDIHRTICKWEHLTNQPLELSSFLPPHLHCEILTVDAAFPIRQDNKSRHHTFATHDDDNSGKAEAFLTSSTSTTLTPTKRTINRPQCSAHSPSPPVKYPSTCLNTITPKRPSQPASCSSPTPTTTHHPSPTT